MYRVYNFEVEETHAYYTSAIRVLSHNSIADNCAVAGHLPAPKEPAGYLPAPPNPVAFELKQLQAKFKHAGDFGVAGNFNKATLAQYEAAIRSTVVDPSTSVIHGTYRGQAATIYFNQKSGLGVIVDPKGNFVSGWKLTPQQAQHLKCSGKLGGG